MNGSPAVVVNKGGFFTTLVKGVFGLIMVLSVCGTLVGLYGLRIVDRHAAAITDLSGGVLTAALENLPEWQEAMPPVIQDALNDRRAVEYRDHVDVSVKLVNKDNNDDGLLVIEVLNRGEEIVSMLPLRVVLEDGDGVPREEYCMYAATPLALDGDDAPGPLLPGADVRKLVKPLFWLPEGAQLSFEMTDLRVANRVASRDEADAGTPIEKSTDEEVVDAGAN